jgi:HipA-like protein
MQSKNIIAVAVYLQRRKSREHVGDLSQKDSQFIFTYNSNYIYKDRAIALGPDLPLRSASFISNSMWTSFLDRLPSKRNPAYAEYCEMVGIDPSEKNLLVLLATLGHKGPSSFIFTPVYQEEFTRSEVINFRKKLNLSVREFGDLFDFSPATVNRIEQNKTSGKDAMKRLEIYYYVPEAALYEVKKNGFKISDEKRDYVEKIILESITATR